MLKKYSDKENTIMLSGWQFLVGGIIMTLTGILMGGRLGTFTVSGVLMLIYLAFISSVAYSIWSLLLKYNPVSRVAVFGFMNPVFGFFLSAILLNEIDKVSVLTFAALAFVCGGIYVVNSNAN